MVALRHIYVRARSIVRIILNLPWFISNSLLAFTRPRSTWTFKRAVLVQVLQSTVSDGVRHGLGDGAGGTYERLEVGKGVLGTYIDPVPELIVGDLARWSANANIQPIQIPGYWIHREGVDLAMGEKPHEGEKVVLFMHGGAYVSFSAHPSSMPCANPKALVSRGGKRVMRALSIEYRLCKPDYAPRDAPNPGPFPAALVDALAGYNYLVKKVGFRAQDIILMGDSAGGNLTLALCRYLVESRSSGSAFPLEPPGAMILLSPWTDMGDSHALGGSYVTNAGSDMLANCFDYVEEHHSSAPRNFVTSKQLEEDPTFYSNPYISPASRRTAKASIAFKGFPKTLICAGGAEMLLDQIRELKGRMVDDMGNDAVRYVEAEDAIHDYCAFPWHEPEQSEFWSIAERWISTL